MSYLIKGSQKALNAGRKAAETRARNKALKGIIPKRKTRGIVMSKITFKKLDEPNYTKLEVLTPSDIYIHKNTGRMYISPHRVVIGQQ